MIKSAKRIFVAILIFATLFVCAACAPVKKQPIEPEINVTVDDENTITILGKKSHLETTYMQRIFKLWNENTQYKILPVAIKNDNFENKATALFANGKIPDIMFTFNDADLARYNAAENFVRFTDEPWIEELTDLSLAYAKDASGTVIGLPFWENSLSGCYYNKTIFEEKGFSPATTQEMFNRLCDGLRSVNIAPLYWAGANGCQWMFQFGLDPVFHDGPFGQERLQKLNDNQINYADIPEVRKMVEWFAQAKARHWFNSDYTTKGWEDIAPAMSRGEAAMIFTWDTWLSEELDKAEGKYTSKDFGLMPVFMNTADHGTYEGGNLNLMMVNKNGNKKDIALDFLQFCATQANYDAAFDGIVTMPCFKNQTTNVLSNTTKEASALLMRPSTAWAKIRGYVQNDVGDAIKALFDGASVDACIALMDAKRLAHEAPAAASMAAWIPIS